MKDPGCLPALFFRRPRQRRPPARVVAAAPAVVVVAQPVLAGVAHQELLRRPVVLLEVDEEQGRLLRPLRLLRPRPLRWTSV